MTGGEIAAILSALGGLAFGLLAFWRSRRNDRTNEKKASSEQQQASFTANIALNEYIDKRVERLVEERLRPILRQLEDERTMGAAMRRILRALVRQWPMESAPDLDPDDIAAIEEELPAHWIRKGGGDPRRP